MGSRSRDRGINAPMTEPSKVVLFASQDPDAARRIRDAHGAAGVEVWFDKSEVRGRNVRDRQIRKQIHDCGLFVPIISTTTQGRLKGYFRREWRLAVDRTHDMSERGAIKQTLKFPD